MEREVETFDRWPVCRVPLVPLSLRFSFPCRLGCSQFFARPSAGKGGGQRRGRDTLLLVSQLLSIVHYFQRREFTESNEDNVSLPIQLSCAFVTVVW
jgi:hypothetical protein